MRRGAVWILVAVAFAGCHRSPRPTYEYEQPVTVISTDAPGGGAAAPTTTTLPPPASPWRRGSRQ